MILADAPRRRLLGVSLLAYGLAGIVVIGVAGVVVGGAVAQLGEASAGIGRQRADLVATLRQTSLTLRDAAAGMGDVGTSLASAHAATDHAAGLARSLNGTLGGLSSAMGIQILGTTPLQGLAGGFATAADQAGQLATDLDQVSGAMATDSGDLATTRQDLATLADRFDTLTASVEGMDITGDSPAVLVELAFAALLLWLAVPAVASVVIGSALLRSMP